MFPNQYFFLVFSGQWLIHNIKDDKKKAVNQCLSAAVQSSKQLFYSLHSIFRRLKLWTSLGKAICLSLVDVFVINFNCHHWFLLSWYISIKIFEFEFPEISGDEWNSIFRKLRKGDKLAGYIVQWRKISYWDFPFHLNFSRHGFKIFGRMVRFSKIQQFPKALRKFPCIRPRQRNFRFFSVEWKVPKNSRSREF